MIRKGAERLNDGLLRIYSVSNAAPPGKLPVERLLLKHTLRYRERTVGVRRYFAYLQGNARVATVLRCPRLRDVSAQDIAVPNDGAQYRILQVQYPEDVTPPVMDLTLEEVREVYDLTGP